MVRFKHHINYFYLFWDLQNVFYILRQKNHVIHSFYDFNDLSLMVCLYLKSKYQNRMKTISRY